MNGTKRSFLRLLAPLWMGVALVGVTVPAAADDYPSKPVRIIVPYTPGGFNDTLARTVGDRLGKVWKQSVVVDNRPGGNTVLGNNLAAKSPSDGYTILVTPLPFSALPALYGSKLPYDALGDFQPLVWAGYTQNALVVRPDLPGVTNLKELIDYAKRNPGKLNYGSTGSGSSNHLSMELFMTMTGTKMTHVPYKGASLALADLLGGQLSFTFDTVVTAAPQIASGKLRGYAVTGPRRASALPQLPTMAELGYRDFDVTQFQGILVPAKTDPAIVQRLHDAAVKALRSPDVVKRLGTEGGYDLVGGSPDDFRQLIRTEAASYGRLIKTSGIKVE